MPSGRKPQGNAPLTNPERQARYRMRRQAAAPAVPVRARMSSDRRSRPQRRRGAVAGLLALQEDHAGWLEALPATLHDTATAEALQATVDRDLETLASAAPPSGYGRHRWHWRRRGRTASPMMLGEGDGLKGCAARTGCAGFGP